MYCKGMKFITLILVLILSISAFANGPICSFDPIIVAVIDTGFGAYGLGRNAHLCKFGHKNFTQNNEMADGFSTKDPVPLDNHGHGTNIVGTIENNAKFSNYCIVVLKYYDPKAAKNYNLDNTIKAINYAISIKADVINYSGGGLEYSLLEAEAVKKFIDQGGVFVAAAGNNKSDLAVIPYYPAMDDSRVIVVGNGINAFIIAPSSNYGKRVDRWEPGIKVTAYGITQTGTSQAAAIATGKIISYKCKNTLDRKLK